MLTRVSRRAAKEFADTIAFVAAGGWTITYAELDRAADEAAAGLATRGFGHGDVIALVMPSVIDYVVLYLAAARLGAVTGGINPRLTKREIGECLNVMDPDLVIVTPDLVDRVDTHQWRHELIFIGDGADTVASAMRSNGIKANGCPDGDPDQPVCICFTSGSTGRPKGAWFTSRQLEVIAELDTGSAWETRTRDNTTASVTNPTAQTPKPNPKDPNHSTSATNPTTQTPKPNPKNSNHDTSAPNPTAQTPTNPKNSNHDTSAPNPTAQTPTNPKNSNHDTSAPNPTAQTPKPNPKNSNHDISAPNPTAQTPTNPKNSNHDISAPNPTAQTPTNPKDSNHDTSAPNPTAQTPKPNPKDSNHGISATAFAHVGFMTKLPWMIGSGRTIHLLERWSAGPVLELIARYQMRAVTGVAPQIALMLRHPLIQTLDFSAVDSVIVGGGLSSPGLVKAARRSFGASYQIRYSSTESGGIGLSTAADADEDEALHTIGRPRLGVEAEIRSADGNKLAPGVIGELWLRSGAVMSGYWNDPEATASTLVDGWLRTGDFAAVDTAGCFRLAGRVTEMFIRGGYNVYPAEVEAILSKLSGIAEIAVVAKPDPVMGEVGVAMVVATDPADAPSLDDLRAFGARELASYKLPEALITLESLPRNSADKIDRRALVNLATRTA